jgi:hypothetical protein
MTAGLALLSTISIFQVFDNARNDGIAISKCQPIVASTILLAKPGKAGQGIAIRLISTLAAHSSNMPQQAIQQEGTRSSRLCKRCTAGEVLAIFCRTSKTLRPWKE